MKHDTPNETDTNPIALRDLLIDESNGFVVECTLRDLVARGWPTHAILAELPTLSADAIRRAISDVTLAAA